MTITLQTIRYYTEDSPYHYTVDNQPLQDLEQNDIALKNEIETLKKDTYLQEVVGTWATLQLTFDLQRDIGRQFAYTVKIWGIQDQSQMSTQVSSLSVYTILGYNDLPGSVSILNNSQVFQNKVGAPTLTPVFTGSGNNLNISFTGYTGTNGYVQVKLERFGYNN